MEQAYYQVPKAIMKLPLNNDARILLMEMIDKLKLSLLPANKKGFTDGEGTPFIRLAQKTMKEKIGRSLPTIRKALRQLETAGLIITKRIGLTCCNIYYLSRELVEWVKNLMFSTERKPSLPPEGKAASASNHNPNNHKYMGNGYTPKDKKYPKGTVLAQQYTQREYTREELMTLVENI